MCVSATTLMFVSAHKADAQKSEIGLRFLPTFSSFEMKTTDGAAIKAQSKTGYAIGALLSHYFTSHFGMQDEIIYSSVSRTYKEQDLVREVNLRYINIPILFSLNTDRSAPVNVNVVAGPQLGINVGSNIFTTGIKGANNSQPALEVERCDFGLAYGAGFDYELNHAGNMRVGLGFRGYYGLTDVGNNSKAINSDSYYLLNKSHLKTYSMYVGFSFLMK